MSKLNNNNLFSNIPNDLSDEFFEDIVATDNVRIERIISNGQTSPDEGWYDQSQNEWVIVIKGRAQLTFENGDVVNLVAGDHINIPSHTKHKVSYTDTSDITVWLAVFY